MNMKLPVAETFDWNDPFVRPTTYWHTLPDGRVQCDLCPRYCKLRNGQRGLCFVRACWDDQIILTTYGKSSGFAVDPIEKKPLNHFLPGSKVFSFGTAGCNLACKFCQNWDISKSREMDTLTSQATPDQIALTAKELNCRSVAFTYNDPVIFHEYAIDVAQACREQGLKSVAVSAGYVSEKPRRAFYRYMDAANIDLKAFTESFYWKLTGSHLNTVLETLCYIKHETNVWLEITTLLIPGENDSPAEIERLCRWVAEHLGVDTPLHFSAFHPDFKMRNTPPTSKAKLIEAYGIAKVCGLHYPYTGNVHDASTQSTYCHQCGSLLIERDWYQLGKWRLDKRGSCEVCGAACSGLYY